MNFIQKNKVMIAAFLSALILVLQQALADHSTDWKAIGFAALIAFIGVIANQWSGQGLTITGIIGTLAGVFYNNWSTGTFTWNEFILTALIAVLTAASASIAPTKSETQQVKFPYNARDGLH